MKFGLLDFGEVDLNSNGIETIHNTINNCQLAEKKGFSRYWLAEHYTNEIAWRNAEIMLTLLAGYTNSIKIGSAGVKLEVSSSTFQIAQNYRTLSSLFENRIDLGFARGYETNEVMEVITDMERNFHYSDAIKKMIKLFNHEFESISLVPLSKINPDLWMLGASNSMNNFCIDHKLNFALSLFHRINTPLPEKDIISNLKNQFLEQNGYLPHTNIAISVFCNDSKRRINEEIKTRKNVVLNVFGTPQECREKIQILLNDYEVDEAIILNLGRNQKEKLFLIENLIA